ncbi:trypsin-like serine peptidase [Rhodopila sp.]|uniref:trypsin-like serine peptidase n=1 Tax=Rhodopila sp. TaxID=2480087 RepID=UPI003D0D29E7
MQQISPEAPEATSQFGLPFTTSQVQPGAALTTYPFSAAGKLFFSEPSGDYVCSASVVRLRIVVTAGHCIASPANGTAPASFFSNWAFVPGYNNGSAPFGMWTPWAVGTTTEWYYGDGSVPNAQDIGMLIMNDQSYAQIGVWVGYLGYKTNSLAGNNVTMLGYPCNLDNCEIMERTDAGNGISGGNNTYEFGSAAGGGASGGPWVQDFGTPPTSTGAGSQNWALGANYLVAVTSYGPTGSQGYLGASELDSSFTDLLNILCTAAPGNC